MRLQASLEGGGRLARKLRSLSAQRRRTVAAAVRSDARLLRDEVRADLSRSGVSLPGRPPAPRSGRLAESVDTDIAADGLSATVGSDLDYGRYLEFGTRRMPARSWLLPAFQRLAPDLAKRILAAARSGP